MSLELEGLSIRVVVSDPWEFGTVHGTGPFTGKILKVGTNPNQPGKTAALVKLDRPLLFDGVQCEFFVAQSRLASDFIEAIATGATVGCGLTCIPPERAYSSDPLDLSWWRGGVGLIASLNRNREIGK